MIKELAPRYEYSEICQFNAIEEVFSSIALNRFIITDDNVYSHYKKYIDDYDHFIIQNGEDYKTQDTVNMIYSYLLSRGYNRNSFIVGIGGGIVTDITGYVASTYMRGVKFGFIPTTLLAMVDASIGGKNGVNFNNYKNIIGCFNHPDFIYICTDFLNTLPKREYNAGIGEILKYAVGFSASLCDDLNNDTIDIDSIISKCILIKTDIVYQDDHESGIRKKLNLGHTIAHAIEKYTHKYMHGEAVYIGLCFMLEYARKNGDIDINDYNKLSSIIKRYQICNIDINKNDFMEYIAKDKKTGDDNTIDIIVPSGIGICGIKRIDINTFIQDL